MEQSKRLHGLMRRQKVLSMKKLRAEMGGRSRVSIFRDLKEVEYLSSYSDAGKYYALRKTARFDSDGLWQYEDIGFSMYGTLKETVFHLVDNSEVGYHHEELQELLRVRLHNTLLDLVTEKRLRRVGIEKRYLYVSANARRALAQSSKREKMSQASILPASAQLTIQILAEVIRENQISVEVEELTQRLVRQKVQVSQRQVAQVLKLYGVKKTLGSR